MFTSSVAEQCGRNIHKWERAPACLRRCVGRTDAPASTHKTWLSFSLMGRSVCPPGSGRAAETSAHWPSRAVRHGERPMGGAETINYAWGRVGPITARRRPIFMNGWISFTFFSPINAKMCLLKGQQRWKCTKDPNLHRGCCTNVTLDSNNRSLLFFYSLCGGNKLDFNSGTLYLSEPIIMGDIQT